MAEPTPEQRAEAIQKARTFAQAFTDWVEHESGIDFWSECNGEDELEERLSNEIAALIAERDAALALVKNREAEADRLREDVGMLAEERASVVAARDAARRAHERLREAVHNDFITFDRDAAALCCDLCQTLTRESVDKRNANHAPDCPLAPLEEK